MFLCTDFPPYTSHSMSMLLCLLGHQSCGRSLWLHHSYYCQHFICKYYVYITPTPLPLLQVLLCTLPKFIIYFFYCFQYISIYMYIYTCMSNLLTSLSFDPMFMCQGLTTRDGKPRGKLPLEPTDCSSFSSYWPVATLHLGAEPCGISPILACQLVVSCWPGSDNHIVENSWVYILCCV